MTRTYAFTVDGGRVRLDRFLGEALREQDVSREKVKRAIRDGGCLVDGAVCTDVSAKVGAGQSIELRMEAEPTSVQPEEGELEILYQDAWLAVLNKPAGMTVHPAPSCPDGTLVHRLVARFPSLRAQEGFRPGIVHRLDKDTSGLICVALTEEARMRLSEAFAAREIRKEYLALVQGVPAPAGTVDAPLGRHPTVKVKVAVAKNGKEARSEWRVLHKGQGYSLLGVRIFTGRTHQIRVHMAHVGHPLWGDKLYGRGGQVLTPPVPGVLRKHDPAPRQMLHAWHLSFIHPFTGEKMAFTCPPPEDFVQTALTLERHMRRVVVTGVAGSGKSLFMRMLAEEGVPTWSADAAVIRLYEPGREAWQALRLRYGDRFIPADRSPVDRKALAAALLPSAESGVDVHELENLLHPLVLDDLERFWSGQEEAGRGYAVAEVPLWFESGWSRKLCGERRPYVVGISCEQGERCRRLLDVRGWSDTLMARMDGLQWTQERKLAGCDKVIANSGTEGALRDKARAFVREMEHWDAESRATFLGQWEHLVNEPCPEAG